MATPKQLNSKQLNSMVETMGLSDAIHLDDTTPTSGKFFAFQVITEAVISSLEEHETAITQMAGVTLSPGFVYYGYITSITLTSGYIKLFKTSIL